MGRAREDQPNGYDADALHAGAQLTDWIVRVASVVARASEVTSMVEAILDQHVADDRFRRSHRSGRDTGGARAPR